jgi:hypothetical protein
MSNVVSILKHKPLCDEEREELSLAKSKHEYFSWLLESAKKAEKEHSATILGPMFNIYGPHKKETTDLFLAFMNNPSSYTWSQIRSYLVYGNLTAWQIWTDHDSKAPRNLSGNNAELFPKPEDFMNYVNRHRLQKNVEWEIEVETTENIIKKYRGRN